MYTVENLTERVSELTTEEKEKLFHLITEHIDLFNKIMPELPFLVNILNNTESDHELMQSYFQWKNNL
jgi:hypothetical protein